MPTRTPPAAARVYNIGKGNHQHQGTDQDYNLLAVHHPGAYMIHRGRKYGRESAGLGGRKQDHHIFQKERNADSRNQNGDTGCIPHGAVGHTFNDHTGQGRPDHGDDQRRQKGQF